MLALVKEYGFHMTPQCETGRRSFDSFGSSEFVTNRLVSHERALAPSKDSPRLWFHLELP